MPTSTATKPAHPDVRHITINHSTALPGHWTITLHPSATVLEMATLMQAYRCRCERIGPDTFQLHPAIPYRGPSPAPTLEDIQRLFEARRDAARPSLKVVPSPAPSRCTCYAPGSYPHDPDCRALMVEDVEC